MSFKASDEAIKRGLGTPNMQLPMELKLKHAENRIKNLQEEKESMKEFYKYKIASLEAQISDLKNYSSITLRDHFAGLAMQKIIDSYDAPIGKLTIVKEAYEWADEMLVIRNKEERNTLLDK